MRVQSLWKRCVRIARSARQLFAPSPRVSDAEVRDEKREGFRQGHVVLLALSCPFTLFYFAFGFLRSIHDPDTWIKPSHANNRCWLACECAFPVSFAVN
jgi:hypothetical protein